MRNGRSPLSSAAWSSMTVVELKAELKERGLKVSGKKAELIERHCFVFREKLSSLGQLY